MDEIEDPVRARIEARDERGPGDRALRRNRGAERRERSLLREALEVRHPPARHQVPRERVIQPVEAEDDHPRALTAWTSARCREDEDSRQTPKLPGVPKLPKLPRLAKLPALRKFAKNPVSPALLAILAILGILPIHMSPASALPSMYAGGSMPNS
jgi:hypothetical protein